MKVFRIQLFWYLCDIAVNCKKRNKRHLCRFRPEAKEYSKKKAWTETVYVDAFVETGGDWGMNQCLVKNAMYQNYFLDLRTKVNIAGTKNITKAIMGKASGEQKVAIQTSIHAGIVQY